MKLIKGQNITIELSGSEVAHAIDCYIAAQGIAVRGPRTIRMNGELLKTAIVLVDPSGSAHLNPQEPTIVIDVCPERTPWGPHEWKVVPLSGPGGPLFRCDHCGAQKLDDGPR